MIPDELDKQIRAQLNDDAELRALSEAFKATRIPGIIGSGCQKKLKLLTDCYAAKFEALLALNAPQHEKE